MSAVTFSANGPWMQFFTKCKVLVVNNMKTGPVILSWKILYHQRWRTNVPFHSIQKLCVILKVLSGWEVIRTQVKINVHNKIIWEFLERFCGWVKPHSSKGWLLELFQSSMQDCIRLGRLNDCEYGSLINQIHFSTFGRGLICRDTYNQEYFSFGGGGGSYKWQGL